MSVLVAAAPIIMVLVLPRIAGWGDVLESALPVVQGAPEAPEILSAISADMGTMAVASLAAIGTLAVSGDKRWIGRPVIACTAASVMMAIASIYAGIRFRFAIVEQIAISTLDLDRIGDRLVTQGATLLAAVSLLLFIAYRRVFHEGGR